MDENLKKHMEEQELIRKSRAVKAKQHLTDELKAKKLKNLINGPDETTDYGKLIEMAKKDMKDRNKCIPFIDEKFNEFVQLGPGSLGLILAQTGTGKSTISANIAAKLIKEGKKVLVIANEEKDSDVAIRVSCLQKDLNIHKFKTTDPVKTYSDEVKEQIINGVSDLQGKLEVRGLAYKNNSDIVTSKEGLLAILEQSKGKYDAIIIDYYQNVSHSLNNPGKDIYTVQHELGVELDKIKHEIGCPIILFAQVKAGKDNYKARIEGRKSIINKCTDIYEFCKQKDKTTSLFMCHKSRWLATVGHLGLMDYVEGKLELLNVHETELDVLHSMATAAPPK